MNGWMDGRKIILFLIENSSDNNSNNDNNDKNDRQMDGQSHKEEQQHRQVERT